MYSLHIPGYVKALEKSSDKLLCLGNTARYIYLLETLRFLRTYCILNYKVHDVCALILLSYITKKTCGYAKYISYHTLEVELEPLKWRLRSKSFEL